MFIEFVLSASNQSLLTSEMAAMWVTALATIGLLIATIVLARLTFLLARASSDPQVVAIIEPARWSNLHLEYKVTNIGTGCAYDILIDFDPPLKAFRGESKLTSLPFNNISIMLPGTQMVSFIGNWKEYFEDEFCVNISWANKPKGTNRQKLKYVFNLKHLHQASTLGNGNGDPMVAMAQELRKIREGIIPALSGRKKIKVDNYSAEDRDIERKQVEEMLSRAKKK